MWQNVGGKEVHRDAETNDGGQAHHRKSGSVEDGAANFNELLNGKGAASYLGSRARLGEWWKWRR